MKSVEQNEPKGSYQARPEALCWRVFRAAIQALEASWSWRSISARLPIVRNDEPAMLVMLAEDLAVAAVKAGGAPRTKLPAMVGEISPVLSLGFDPVLQRVARAVAADMTALTLDSKPWRGTPLLQAAERLSDALATLNWSERATVWAALLFGRSMAEIGQSTHVRASSPAEVAAMVLEAALERMNRFYEVDRPDEGARWFVVEVKGGQETTAKFHLERQRFEVYLPLRFLEVGAKSKHAPFFPRYLFVRMDPEERQWGAINSTMGVVHLVAKADGRPAPVAGSMIERIRSWERGGTIALVARPVEQLRAGDAVRITSGCAAGLDAIVQTPNDGKRTKMMLEFAAWPESSFKISTRGSTEKVAVLR